MKKLNLLIGLASSFVLFGCGKSEDKNVTVQEPTCTEEFRKAEGVGFTDNPYFYKIQAKTGKVSYILGTIHIGFALSDLPAYITSTLEKSKYIVGEYAFPQDRVNSTLTLENSNVISMLNNRLETMGYSNLQQNSLNQTQRNRLVCHGFTSQAAKYAQPTESVCSLVQMAPYYRGFIDVHVYLHANRNGKSFTALDTDELLRESDRYDNKTENKCDMISLLNTPVSTINEAYGSFFKKYRQGDEFAFYLSKYDGVAYRNEKWMPKLTTALDRGDNFITMGAAHLRGVRGVLTMLLDQGYKIERWTNSVQNPILARASSTGSWVKYEKNELEDTFNLQELVR